jgi:predicted DNA-binding WGR domain protein
MRDNKRIGLSSCYLEPGIYFKVSYEINRYISQKLDEEFADKIQMEERWSEYELQLNVTTTQDKEAKTLRGPSILKKHQFVRWVLVLPYEQVTSADDLTTAYIDALFDVLVELFARYRIEEAPLRNLQATVKKEVIGNPSYELTEEELFELSLDEMTFDFVESDEQANSMYYPTLIQQAGEELLYWEIWYDEEDAEVMIHWGTVGDTGELHYIPLVEIEDLAQELAVRFQEKVEEGYRKVEPAEKTELVIQYRYRKNELPQAIEKREHVESLLDFNLSRRGNGECRDGETGTITGTVNTYCQVLNVAYALDSILEELTAQGLLEGVTIGYLDEEEEDYVTLHPAEEKGQSLTTI